MARKEPTSATISFSLFEAIANYNHNLYVTIGRPQICFFNRRCGDIIFSSLVSFAFLCILVLFFCLFVCFLKLKIYILIQIWLCGWVSDKKFFTRPVSGNKAIFISPDLNKFNVIKIFTNNWLKTEWIMGQFKNSETSADFSILA